MIPEKTKEILKRQHYIVVGNHSATQICRWTKKSLLNDGECYKEKFYGIKSHLCCQMSPSLICPNKCVHCWRAIELDFGKESNKTDSAKDIIDGCIKAQRKLLTGFKSNKKIDMKKWKQAQEPMQFAISLSGEPMIYNKLGELIAELRKRKKTSFLVTNGLYPEKIKELIRKKQLPTQLYISVNTSNEDLYNKFHRSSMKNAWKKLNQSLELMGKMKNKTRTVVRINLVKNLNMNDEMIEDYAKLIMKAKPMFIEIKGYMAVGYARQRLGYERMPWHKDIKDFSKKLLKFLKKDKYKFLDEKEESRVVLLGKSKRDMKIKKI
ncbi:MAG: 4-demethylwyosine synthase TYW1 [archaeon]|nr:4-demethylwyosine synthase TYW1 [archaeon]